MGKTVGDFGLLGTGGESVLMTLQEPGLTSTEEGPALVAVTVLTLVTMVALQKRCYELYWFCIIFVFSLLMLRYYVSTWIWTEW